MTSRIIHWMRILGVDGLDLNVKCQFIAILNKWVTMLLILCIQKMTICTRWPPVRMKLRYIIV